MFLKSVSSAFFLISLLHLLVLDLAFCDSKQPTPTPDKFPDLPETYILARPIRWTEADHPVYDAQGNVVYTISSPKSDKLTYLETVVKDKKGKVLFGAFVVST